jgi:hypothetical protein
MDENPLAFEFSKTRTICDAFEGAATMLIHAQSGRFSAPRIVTRGYFQVTSRTLTATRRTKRPKQLSANASVLPKKIKSPKQLSTSL